MLKTKDLKENSENKDFSLHDWISMSEAAGLTPYSAEYLSLLARKKKLSAKKIGKTWYTTKGILEEYMHRQMIRNQVQNGDLSSVARLVSTGSSERSKDFIQSLVGVPPQAVEPEKVITPIEEVKPVEVTPTPVAPVVDVSAVSAVASPLVAQPMFLDGDDASIDHPQTTKLRTYHGDLKKYLDSLAHPDTTVHVDHVHMPKSLGTFKNLFSPKHAEVIPEKVKEIPKAVITPRVSTPTTTRAPLAPKVSPRVEAPVSIKPEEIEIPKMVIPQAPEFAGIARTLDEISKRLEVLATKEATRSATPTADMEQAFARVLDEKLPLYAGAKKAFSNIVTRSFRTVAENRSLAVLTLGAILFFAIFPTPFVFGFFEKTLDIAKTAWTDANTVMGFRPGTHENEILLLDKSGNVSIMGHIETEGQFRSYIQDGVAPIVVDSKTLVKNLNAEYVGGNSAQDFTLAFVTKNGNVTTEDVYLDGNVEVGKTLLVKGATKLLSSLTVDGNISVFGDAHFAKTLSVDGPAYFESIVNATNIAAQGVISGGEVVSRGNINAGKNVYVKGSVDVKGSVVARNASFNGLGVSGDFSAGGEIELGNPSDILTINSKNVTLDRYGNFAIDGSAEIAGNLNAANLNAIGTSSAANINVTNLAIINSLIATSSVTVDATTTNAFTTNATTTNAYVTELTVDNSTTTNLFAVNSSTTNATTTNLFSASSTLSSVTIGESTTTNATSTSFFSSVLHALSATIDSLSVTLANITGLTVTNSTTTNATTTNGYVVNLTADNSTTTNATSTNFFANTFRSLFATITSLIANDVSVDALTATNSTTTNATTTNAYVSSGTIDGLVFTNATGTNATTTNLFSTNASTSNATSTNLFAVNSNTTYSTTTLLHISGAGTSTVAGNFSVAGNLEFGTGLGNTLAINGAIASDLVPDVNLMRNIGSPSFYWNRGYFDNITVNNLSAASSSISGTVSESFTINSDNVSADAQDMDLIFKRGIVTPNALLSWDSTLDKFKFNQPLYIENESLSNTITLEPRGWAGQTADIFRVSSSTGSSLFNVMSSGNVGVGTASPAPSIGLRKTLALSDTTNDVEFRMFGTSGINMDLFTNGSVGGLTVRSAHPLALGTSNAERMRIDAMGNIGIGTTSPWGLLSVNPNGISGPSFVIGSSTKTDFLVTNAGIVGIGTSSPTSAMLSIASTTASGSFFEALRITNNNTAGNGGYIYFQRPGDATRGLVIGEQFSGGGNSNLSYIRSAGGLSQELDIGTGLGTTGQRGRLFINSSNLSATGNGTGSGQLGIGSTTPGANLSVAGTAGGTGPLVLVSSSTASFATSTAFIIDANGKVGIGTTTSLGALNVLGGGSTSLGAGTLPIQVYSNGDNTYSGFNIYSPSNYNQFFAWGMAGSTTSDVRFGLPTANGAFIFANDGSGAGGPTPSKLAIGLTTNAPIYFANANTVRMTIASTTGNIGIGTTTPYSKFTVLGPSNVDPSLTHGTVAVASFGANAGSELSLGGFTTSPFGMWLQARHTVADIAVPLSLNPLGGNVGIGTTTPATNLQVSGTTGLRIAGTTGNFDTIDLVPGAASSYDRLDFKAVTANRGVAFQLNPNGTSQNSKLSLANAQSSTDFGSLFISTEGTQANISTQTVGSGIPVTNLVFGGGTGAGNWVSTIFASGNVGIGTTSPFARLSVAGDAYIGGNLTATGTLSVPTLSVTGLSGNMLISTDASSNIVTTSTPQVASINATSTTATSTFAGSVVVTGTNLWIPDGGLGFASYPSTGLTQTSSGATLRLNTQGVSRFLLDATNATFVVNAVPNTDNGRNLGDATRRWANLFVGLGNVSVGTTSPGARFALEGAAGATSPLVLISTSTSGFSTSTALIVDANGRMGIGTSTPDEKLSINGSISFTAGGSVRSASTTKALAFGMVNSAGAPVGGYFNTFGRDAGAAFQKGSVEAVADTTVNPDAAFNVFGYDGTLWNRRFTLRGDGNMGIGTTSPFARLAITGSSTDATNAFLVANSSNIPLFNILNNGNVGIGTSTPANKLVVSGGTDNISGAVSFAPGTSGNNRTMTITGQYIDVTATSIGNAQSLVLQSQGGLGGNVGIGTTSPTETLSVASSGGDSAYFAGDVGVGVRPTSASGANLSVMGLGTQASPSLLRIFGQNNTTAAEAELRISQIASGSDLRLLTAGVDTRTDGLTANDQYAIAGQRLNLMAYGNGTAPNTWINIDGPAAALRFYTNSLNATGTERMRIDSTGNVGIGTSTPSAKLDIYSSNSNPDFSITESQSGSAAQMYLRNTARAWEIGSDSNPDIFYIGQQGVQNTFVITPTGDVGIGTSSPTNMLTIKTDGTTPALRISGNASAPANAGLFISSVDEYSGAGTGENEAAISVGASFGFSGGNVSSWTAGDTSFGAFHIDNGSLNYFADSGLTIGNTFTPTSRLFVGASGLVGIGTTSPFAKLSVAGDAYIGGDLTATGTLSANAFNVTGTGTTTFAGDILARGIAAWQYLTAPTIVATSTTSTSTFAGALKVNTGNNFPIILSGLENAPTTYAGLWLGQNTASAGNYAFLGTNGQTFFNTANTGTADLEFRVGNNTRFTVGNSGAGVFLTGNTAPTKPFQVNVSSGGASAFNVESTGNVGVGSTTPYDSAGSSAGRRVLAVEDATNGAEVRVSNGASGATVNVKAISTGGYIGTQGAHDFFFQTQNSNRAVLTSAGNFGIGTSTPNTRFEVFAGSGNGGDLQISGDANNTFLDASKGFALRSGKWNGTFNTGAILDSSGNMFLGYSGGGLTVGQSYNATTPPANGAIIQGNVGIGTTTPLAKLQVAGNTLIGGFSNSVADFRIQRTSSGVNTSEHTYVASTNSPHYLFGQNLTWTSEQAGTVESTAAYRPYYEDFIPVSGLKTFGFVNVTSGAFTSANMIPSLALKNTGEVGIGTTSPFAKLSVAGDAYIGGNLTATGTLSVSGAISAPYFVATDAAATSTFAGGLAVQTNKFVVQQTSGNVGVGSLNPVQKFQIGDNSGTSLGFRIAAVGVNWDQTTDANGHLSIGNGNGAYLTFNRSSVISSFNGSVGIGTTSPLGRLEIASTVGTETDLRLSRAGNSSAYLGFTSVSGANTAANININGTNVISPMLNGGVAFGGYAGGSTAAPANGIIVSGNVGIGTSSPLSLFSIKGADTAGTNSILLANSNNENAFTVSNRGLIGGASLDLGLTPTGANQRTIVRVGNISNDASAGIVLNASQAAASLMFQTGTVERMRIDQNGAVGIGTTSPVQKLAVAGNGYFTGNVGIGQNREVPATALDVTGNLKLRVAGDTSTLRGFEFIPQTHNADSVIRTYGSSGGLLMEAFQTASGATTARINFNPAGYISFSTHPTAAVERMRLDSSGNFGIGTTSPFAKLSVHANNGDTNAQLFAVGSSTASATTTLFSIGNTGQVTVNESNSPTAADLLFNGFGGSGGIGAASGQFRLFAPNGSLGAYFDTNFNVLDTSGANVFATFDRTNQRLGIGTTTPGAVGYAKLQLHGTDSNAAGPHMQFTTTADSRPLLQILPWSHDNVALAFDSYFDGSWKSSSAGSNFKIQKTSDGLGFDYANGVTAGSAPTWATAMKIADTGNVGIGTTSPQSKLQIYTGVNDGLRVENSTVVAAAPTVSVRNYSIYGNVPFLNTANGYGIQGYDINTDTSTGIRSLVVPSSDSGTTPLIMLEGSGHVSDAFSGITTVSTRPILGINNYTSRLMTVLAGGNVGIGTSTPFDRLSIVGTNDGGEIATRIVNNSTNSASTASIKFTVTTNQVYDGGEIGAARDNGNYLFFNTDDATRMVVGGNTLNGNIGIGTTSPQKKLDLWGTANTELARFTGTGSGDRSFGIGTYTPNSGGATLYANGTAVMSLHALQGVNIGAGYTGMLGPQNGLLVQGLVGIGTTSPFAKLSVAGDAYIGGDLTATGTLSVNAFNVTGTGTTTFAGDILARGIAAWQYLTAPTIVATSTTATSTFAGGLSVANGAIQYDYSSGVTSIDNLTIGQTNFDADSGIINWVDMPVTAAASNNTIESYTANLNGNPMLTIYGLSDGAGGVKNRAVGIGTTSPWAFLSVNPNGVAGPSFAIGSSTETDFVVTNAGNVGIGTTSPSDKLSVDGGDNKGKIFSSVATADAVTKMYRWTGVSTNYYPWYLATGRGSNARAFSIMSGSSGIIGTETVSDLLTVDNNGNVGIGTTTPGTKLQVAGNAIVGIAGTSAGTGSLTLRSDSAAVNAETFDIAFQRSNYDPTGTGAAITFARGGSSADGQLIFKTNNQTSLGERMRITTTGNVGVGTSTPNVALSVVSSLVGGSNMQLTNTSSSGYSGLDINNSSGLLASSMLYANASAGILPSSLFIGTRNTTDSLHLVTGATTPTPRLTITSAGNVGIGTTTPTAKFNVYSSASPTVAFQDDTAALKFFPSSGVNYIQSGTSLSTSNADLRLTTMNGGTTFIAMQGSTGNVGIGTTTPDKRLVVNGDLKVMLHPTTFASKNVAQIMALGFSGITGAENWTLRGAYQYGSGIGLNADGGDLDLIKSMDANTILGTKTDGTGLGNVGIGTTSPLAKLDVAGTNNLTVPLFQLSSVSAYATTSRFIVTNAGNVGIGTTSPTDLMVIEKNQNASTQLTISNTSVDSGSGTNAVSQFYLKGSGGNFLGNVGAYGDDFSDTTLAGKLVISTGSVLSNGLQFRVAGSNAMIINNSGNVGIGTTTPVSLTHIYKSAGDAILSIENTGNGNSSGIDFIRQRSTGTSVTGGSIFMDSDTSGTNALLYIQSQSASAQSGVTGALTAANGARMVLRGGTGEISFENGATESARFSAAGNLGIGTTSPYAKLSVVGPIVGQYLVATDTSATTTLAGGFDVNNGSLRYDFSSGVTSIDNLELGASMFGADSGIISWADMPVTASASIGTVESYSAQIDGNPLLTVYSESDGAGGIQNSRVGVGTSTPGATFAVQGDGLFSGTVSAANIVATGTMSFGTTTVTNLIVTNTSTSTFAGSIDVNNAGTNATSTIAGNLWVKGTLRTGTGSLYLNDTSINAANGGFQINTTGNSYTNVVSGGFGVGTTTPANKLDIYGANPYLAIDSSNAGNGGIKLNVQSAEKWRIDNIVADNHLRFLSNVTTEVMSLTQGGNVGIGTTTPQAKMVIAETVSNALPLVIEGTIPSSNNYTGISFERTGEGQIARLSVIAESNAERSMQFFTDTGSAVTEAMRIRGSGNVGIGTTTPVNKLTVTADANTSGAIQNSQLLISGSTSPTKRLYLGFNTSSNYGVLSAETSTGAYAPIIVAPYGGNVGIATTTPNYKLSVVGTNAVAQVAATNNWGRGGEPLLVGQVGSAGAIQFARSGDGSAQGYIGYSSGAESNEFVIGADGGGGYMKFSTAGAEHMRLTAAGSLGIATTSPWAQLSVGMSSTTPALVVGVAGSSTPSLYVGSANSNGYVGVGTSAPTAPLDIQAYLDNTNPAGLIVRRNSTQYININELGGGQHNIQAIDPSANPKPFVIAKITTGGAPVAGSSDISFSINQSGLTGVTPLTLQAATGNALFGYNVGIGTTTPTALLSLDSSITGDTPNFQTMFQIGRRSANRALRTLNFNGNNGSFVTQYTQDYSTWTDLIAYDVNNGRIGIGTTSPNSQLQIAGTAQTTANLTDAGVTGGTLNITDSNPSNPAGAGGALLFSSSATSGVYPQAAIKSVLSNGSGRGIGSLAFSVRTANGDTALTEAMRITNAGNVGIGTTSPASLLAIGNGLTSGGFYFSDTGLGIGVTSPSAGLHIKQNFPNIRLEANSGNVNYRPAVTLKSGGWTSNLVAGSEAGSIMLTDSSDTVRGKISFEKYDASNTNLNFYTGSAVGGSNLFIRGGGNVGVGTTTPNWSLQIASSTPYLAITDTDAVSGGKHWLISNNGGSFTIGTSSDALNSTSTVLSINANGTTTLSGFLDVLGTGANATSTFASNLWVKGTLRTGTGSLYFNDTSINAANSGFSFNTTGNSYVNGVSGNFGVGTTSPSQALSVNGAIYATGGIRFADGSTQTGAAAAAVAGTTGQIPYYAADGTTFTATSTVFISTASNVGIGLTPSEKLTIGSLTNGTNVSFGFRAQTPGGASSRTIYTQDATTGAHSIIVDQGQNGSARAFALTVGAATNALYVNSSGNVGISSTTPIAKLTVSSTGGGVMAPSAIIDGAGGNASLTINGNSTSNYAYQTFAQGGVGKAEIGVAGSGDAAGGGTFYINQNIQSGATGASLVVRSGNVGIGTTTPSTKLQVKGGSAQFIGAADTWSGMVLGATATNRPMTSFRVSDNSERGKIEINDVNSASGDRLGLFAYSAGLNEVMSIRGNGNVGIGTTTPGSQLNLFSSAPAIELSPSGYGGTSYATYLGSMSNATGVLQLGNNGLNDIIAGNTAAGGSLRFVVNNSSTFPAAANGTVALTLGSTGAATFGSTVTGTTLNATTGINTGAGAGTLRIDASGNLSNIGTINSGAITSSGNTTMSADAYTTYGPNSGWGAYLRVGGNGRTVPASNLYASVAATDGNLHLDAGTAKTLYLNYYSGTGGTIFGNGASGVSGASVSSTGVYTGTGLTVGSGTITSGLINGQTISSAANFTGTVAAATSVTSPVLAVTSGGQFMAGNVAQNMKLKAGGTSATGISGYDSSDVWRWQLYGDGSNYGFLNANWGGWDMQKTIGGALVLNGSQTVLHSGNYNSYSPTLTGTGASGTWGINVTGNAGTVSNGMYTNANNQMTSGNWIRFGHANQTDTNDGIIGAGIFASGLNIVGTQTTAATGRQVRVWGTLMDSAGTAYITDGNTSWDNAYGFITDGNTNWDNSYGYITDGNTNWDNAYGFITDGNTNWDNSYGLITNNVGNGTFTAGRIELSSTNDPGSDTTAVRMYYGTTNNGNTGLVLRGWNMDFQAGNNGDTSSKIFIDNAGSVGINDATPSYRLDVNGDIRSTGTYYSGGTPGASCADNSVDASAGIVTNCGTYSDQNLKTVTGTLTNSLDKLATLQPVYFSWNDAMHAMNSSYSTSTTQLGLIAQDVQAVFPEFVTTGNDGYLRLNYAKISSALVGGVNELNTRTSFISSATTTQLMFIDTSGNIGIGTSTPQYKLHVLGDVAAQSFINISTRTQKKDISYLDEPQKASILDEIKKVGVATYRYNNEDETDALHLGLIAEEAPTEVLATGGKGVDVYKLSTFILAGVQELADKLGGIEDRLTLAEMGIVTITDTLASTTARVATTEAILASTTVDVAAAQSAIETLKAQVASLMSSETTVVGNTGTTTQVVTWSSDSGTSLLSYLETMGLKLADGIAYVKNAVIETMTVKFATIENAVVKSVTADALTVGSADKRSGITLYDEFTGEPYCLRISNGVTVNAKGACPEGMPVPGITATSDGSATTTPVVTTPVVDTTATTTSDTATSTTPDTTVSTSTSDVIIIDTTTSTADTTATTTGMTTTDTTGTTTTDTTSSTTADTTTTTTTDTSSATMTTDTASTTVTTTP